MALSLKQIFGKTGRFRQTYGPFILLTAGFMAVQILFFYLIGGTGLRFSAKWLFFSSLLFSVFASLFRTTGAAVVWLLVYTLLLQINLLYFRYYNALLAPDAFRVPLTDLLSLSRSGLYAFRVQDLSLYLPFTALLFFFRFKQPAFRIISFRSLGAGSGLLFLIFSLYLYPQRERIQEDLNRNFGIWRPTFAYQWFGYPAYLYYNICTNWQQTSLSPAQQKEIETFLAAGNKAYTRLKQDTVRRNLLLIVVESLESFPIGKTVDNQEITPFLNRLINDSLSFYASRVVTQVKDGMSSDGQLILNTGLLPLQRGAACYLAGRSYPSLARLLKKYKNYPACVTLLGHSPGIWNQAGLSKACGFDKLYSENDFDNSDAFNVGMSDLSLFRQAVPILRTLPRPFFAQLITVSSHTPFRLPEEKKKIRIGAPYPPEIAGYLESINYADSALAWLFRELETEGILQHTTVVITGDHYAFPAFFRQEMLRQPGLGTLAGSYGFLPLIVYNGNTAGREERILGQVDIFPSLLDLMQVPSPWKGLGQSVFDPGHPGAAATPEGEIAGNPADGSGKLIRAWELSDRIIRSNYAERLK